MKFTEEVNWSATDFGLMGLLLFSSGMGYVWISRVSRSWVYRAAVALALGTLLLLVWANLAVGLIGSGPHAGNWMYASVVVVGILGIVYVRFTPVGMERVMYTLVGVLAVLASIALLTGMEAYPGSSVREILGVNGFFALLFTVSGLLFRWARLKETKERNTA
jgi:hypothetical protein